MLGNELSDARADPREIYRIVGTGTYLRWNRGRGVSDSGKEMDYGVISQHREERILGKMGKGGEEMLRLKESHSGKTDRNKLPARRKRALSLGGSCSACKNKGSIRGEQTFLLVGILVFGVRGQPRADMIAMWVGLL